MSENAASSLAELPLPLVRQIEQVCRGFENAWQQAGTGTPPKLEDYLTEASNPTYLPMLRELIALEVHYREAAGDVVRPDEYLARFPVDRDWLMIVLRTRAGGQTGASGLTVEARALPSSDTGSSPLLTGQVVGDYDLIEEVGRGGMGVVYKARDRRLGRTVAVKFLQDDGACDPDRVERFWREARAAGALNHPAICTLHQLGEHEGRLYLVLEWIDGQTFRAFARTCAAPGASLPLLRQVAGAIQAAHAAGIVHRDLKPENLMVRKDGYVKVLDFGLARLLPGTVAEVPGKDTKPGMLVGTVAYMSPEQSRSEPVGPPSDVFSLGVVAYEMVVGRHPFEAPTRVGMLQALGGHAPLPPRRLNPEIGVELEALVLRMLAKEPHLRPSAEEVENVLASLSSDAQASSSLRPRKHLVGRERERQELRSAWAAAIAGRGTVVCLTGEPGLGKTTLAEDLAADLEFGRPAAAVGRGRCSERLAGSEAYLPILEALESLLRSGAGDVARLLQTVAPTWYAQAATLTSGDAAPSRGASQERMKLEMLTFVQELSRMRPLLLFLDDLHWADNSTVDLLAYLANRLQGLSVLILFTYRPTELVRAEHPFHSAKFELQRQDVCRELPLGFLNHADIERYLNLTFPGHALPEAFMDWLHARTEGNPLFVVDLLRYLCDRGSIAQDSNRWVLTQPLDELPPELPDSLRGLVLKKMERLEQDERHVLGVASVQGYEFDAAVVTGVLSLEAVDVEEKLEELDRVHGLVRRLREREFPDGTLTVRYQFIHALYQNAFYQALQPARRTAWSLAVARSLLGLLADRSDEAAGELALLFETGRDFARAADHFLKAARNAAGVSAYKEAVLLARRGLGLLPRLPDTPERARQELLLQFTLGGSLMIAQGFTASAVEAIYDRARALLDQVGTTTDISPVYWGLWGFYFTRGDFATAGDLSEQLLRLAQATREPSLLFAAHCKRGHIAFHLGHFQQARAAVESALANYSVPMDRLLMRHVPFAEGVPCCTVGAMSLWPLGYPEQAAAYSRKALDVAREINQPHSIAAAYFFAAWFHCLARDDARTLEHAQEAVTLCMKHDIPYWLAAARCLRGWARAQQGDVEPGISEMQEALAEYRVRGARTNRPFLIAQLAQTLGRHGRPDEAAALFEEALQETHQTNERWYEAELLRLGGELAQTRGGDTHAARDEARARFHQALAVAQQQEARSFELRVAMSLTRLCADENDSWQARERLVATRSRFSEGADTPDLREARSLLGQ